MTNGDLFRDMDSELRHVGRMQPAVYTYRIEHVTMYGLFSDVYALGLGRERRQRKAIKR